ncbi:hypothetical protein RJD24_07015 [Bacillaceae bacterium IKA-2]|nr:hypothetical protein RJD24_07015 [Bacillaceae bacterium IKA-2]
MNWLFSSFRSGRIMQQMLEMGGMRRRRNNRSLMLSIVGVGIGAAAVSMMRNRGMSLNMNNMMEPIKEAVGDMDIKNPIG